MSNIHIYVYNVFVYVSIFGYIYVYTVFVGKLLKVKHLCSGPPSVVIKS